MKEKLYITITTKPIGVAAAENLPAVTLTIEPSEQYPFELDYLLSEAQRRLEEMANGED